MANEASNPNPTDEDRHLILESKADIEAARKRISEKGFNPVFRVRDLKETIAEFQRRTRDRVIW
jgi:hypothetical protein